MTINIMKSLMLLLAALGPKTVLALSIITTIQSLVMALITFCWFSYAKPRHISDQYQPCSKAFINVWKSASYSAAVFTGIVVLSANVLGTESFPIRAFIPVLVVTWLGVIFSFFGYYLLWRRRNISRMQVVEELLMKPFDNYEKHIWYHKAKESYIHSKERILNMKTNNPDILWENRFPYDILLENKPK